VLNVRGVGYRLCAHTRSVTTGAAEHLRVA